mgnify:CR=1 FL=1
MMNINSRLYNSYRNIFKFYNFYLELINKLQQLIMTDLAGAGGQMDNDFVQMGVDPAQYEALEKDFQEVLNELVGDQSMEKFRKEYEKLHRALKTSYESE